jgi:UDP-N-acetyl-D-mannosaminuronate dehydrogenase
MSKAGAVAPREQTSCDRIADRSFQVGIIGLGYVGLPLARTFARNGFAPASTSIPARRRAKNTSQTADTSSSKSNPV